MPLPLANAATVLRAVGLTVVELNGWQFRGQDDGPFAPRGLMWHHDASAPGDSPGVAAMMANLNNNGAQFWVDRAGRWHCIAAGRMWHAGSGGGFGRIPANQGNTYCAGVETDHTTGEAWPAVQVDSLRRGSAALLKHLNANPADALCGHKEYRTTNPDPDGLDMAHERRVVADIMNGADDMPLTPKDVELIFWGVEFDKGKNFAGYLKDVVNKSVQDTLTTLTSPMRSGADTYDITPRDLWRYVDMVQLKVDKLTAEQAKTQALLAKIAAKVGA